MQEIMAWQKKKPRYSSESPWFPEYYIGWIGIGNCGQKTSTSYYYVSKLWKEANPIITHKGYCLFVSYLFFLASFYSDFRFIFIQCNPDLVTSYLVTNPDLVTILQKTNFLVNKNISFSDNLVLSAPSI
jgi:hypothetical protein